MANEKKVVTGLGKPEIHRVLIRGYDLTKDLVGKITFADMTYLMLVGRFPNDGERRMTDALLTILVEHGMVSSVVSARLCYSTAPEALQAAVASSILGAGSVHLGSSEYSAKMLVKGLPASSAPSDLDAAAASVVEQHAKKKKRIAGIGHQDSSGRRPAGGASVRDRAGDGCVWTLLRFLTKNLQGGGGAGWPSSAR